MLKEYEDKQRALEGQEKAVEERRRQQELQQQMKMEEWKRSSWQQVYQFNDQSAQVVTNYGDAYDARAV